MLVEKIKCLQNSNKGTGTKERGKESEWKNCVLLPESLYIPVYSGMKPSWMEQRLTAGGQGRLDWGICLLGTNIAAYVVHWEWRHLSHDCSTGITLLLYLHIKNYFSDFSRMSEKLDYVLSASQTSERWSAVIHWAGSQKPCHSLGLNKSFNWKTA